MKRLLLLAAIFLAGCTSAPVDRTGQILVREWWYVSLDPDKVARHRWDNFAKVCKYTDGVLVYVDREECPVRWKDPITKK